jgi:RNA polymerase sigma-54 factor
MIKQKLHLELSQRLTLTPQLQQAIKLLQLSTLDMCKELEDILVENPALERSEEPAEISEAAEYWGSRGQGLSSSIYSKYRDHDQDPLYNIPEHKTLRDHLLSQLGEHHFEQRLWALVHILIDEIDDQGYLSHGLQDILDHLPLELEISYAELEHARKILLDFDPMGVGSLNLQEYLLIQLNLIPLETHALSLAKKIVGDYFEYFVPRSFSKLKKILPASDLMFDEARRLIQSLRPRPAYGFDQDVTYFVHPDIFVKKIHGVWKVIPNQSVLPAIKVNQAYVEHLVLHKNKVLHQHVQDAKSLIKNIQQRAITIVRVAEIIVDRQQAFFEYGEEAMQALVLKDVADELSLHESTISRVTSQKYLLCSRGMFELKYFFGNALDTPSGGSCSATAIKAMIKRMVQNEEPKNPLSDTQIVSLLAEQGVRIARRTVSKYRDALGLPSASVRRI